jgi:lysophospholipid acyltransferase (LPLAT)-like uncharacterized protein
MKIRNPQLVRAAGWLAATAATAIGRTLHFDHRCVGPDVGYARPTYPDRLVFSIWHEKLLLPTVRFGGPDLAVLISQHADGQLLGGLIRRMGMGLVCGSTNRGGVEAVRQIVRPEFPWRHLAITPDGPRGPRREVQPGVVFVASRTGMKIVPMGVGYYRPWRMKSWDRFCIPRPTSRARILFGEPIDVPAKLRSEEMEPYRTRVQAEMDRLDAIAEDWAITGRLNMPDARNESARRAA